VGERLKPPVC